MTVSLVTGAAGFMGSHVVDHLIGMGHEVIALDDLSGGFRDNVNPKATFVEGSVVDQEVVDRVFREHTVDYVYHLAAYAAEGLSHFIKRFNYTNNLMRFGFDDDDFADGGNDRLVDTICVWGDVDAVAARVRAHLDAGADHVAVQVLVDERRGLPRSGVRGSPGLAGAGSFAAVQAASACNAGASPPPSHARNSRVVETRQFPGSRRNITSPRLTRSHRQLSLGLIFIESAPLP